MLVSHKFLTEKQLPVQLMLKENILSNLVDVETMDTLRLKLNLWIHQLMSKICLKTLKEMEVLSLSIVLREELFHKNIFQLVKKDSKKVLTVEFCQDLDWLMCRLIFGMVLITMLTPTKWLSKLLPQWPSKMLVNKLALLY